MNTKRLFFALWPQHEVRLQLRRLQKTLDLSAGRQVHELDMHVTLQYLGQVSMEQLDCVKAAALMEEVSPFTLEVEKVHYWRKPRILWAGFTHTPSELLHLVLQLGERLSMCGFKREKRAYCPHVTLMRKAKSMAGSSQLTERFLWRVNEFVLVESHTDGRIPRYEVITRFALDR